VSRQQQSDTDESSSHSASLQGSCGHCAGWGEHRVGTPVCA